MAFFELVDQNGRVLAETGIASRPAADTDRNKNKAVYEFEEPLPQPRNPRSEAGPHVAGWRIRIGLYSSDANFILTQAYLQLGVSILAIAALVALSVLSDAHAEPLPGAESA